jgi:predicted kinase
MHNAPPEVPLKRCLPKNERQVTVPVQIVANKYNEQKIKEEKKKKKKSKPLSSSRVPNSIRFLMS